MFNMYGLRDTSVCLCGDCVFQVWNIVLPFERLARRVWWDYSLTAYMRLQCMIGSLICVYGIL